MKFFIMLFFLVISGPTMSQSNNSAKIIPLTSKEYQSINVAANYFTTKKNPNEFDLQIQIEDKFMIFTFHEKIKEKENHSRGGGGLEYIIKIDKSSLKVIQYKETFSR
ncbi:MULTISPECIES: hypothetical protein [unclassified Acidovorax]|uniref:hypothetical protein n=1 Tax=unclassified Acidovorax TaxID=2684926 RepID=UPI000A91BD63|nr:MULTISPECIES: hypothetical protein [unclassified Acidovorax]